MTRSAPCSLIAVCGVAAIAATSACSRAGQRAPQQPQLPSGERAAAPAPQPQAEPAPAGQETEEQNERALGEVQFEISCAPEAQRSFNHALALLHHMMYRQARQAFERLAEQSPECAMAHWGIAMTVFHPLWNDPPTAEEFEQGAAAIERARELGAETSRERAYLEAAAAYYGGADERPETGVVDEGERFERFERATAKLHRDHPDDPDAAAFHALALLATAPAGDPTYAHQREAAAILTAIHGERPRHPGAIHYGIHAHDFPPLAAAGTFLADVYDSIAPDVPHALHMPSHIFVRLGEWRKTVDWNRRSAEAAARQPVDGARSMHYAHALDYMMYAYLQRMDDERARAVIEDIDSTERYEMAPPTAYAIAAIHARLPLERRDWEAASRLDKDAIEAQVSWSEMPFAETLLVYARGLGAARSGDVAAARRALAELEATLEQLEAKSRKNTGLRYWHTRAQVQRDTLAGWIAHAAGRQVEARRLMIRAADREKVAGKHPTMPAFVLPARELLGDMLLEQKRPREALAVYMASLREFPRRANSLHGVAAAAKQLGARDIALEYSVQLASMAASPDAERPILREALEYLESQQQAAR